MSACFNVEEPALQVSRVLSDSMAYAVAHRDSVLHPVKFVADCIRESNSRCNQASVCSPTILEFPGVELDVVFVLGLSGPERKLLCEALSYSYRAYARETHYHVHVISTTDVLKAEAQSGNSDALDVSSALGRGEMVSDSALCELVVRHISDLCLRQKEMGTGDKQVVLFDGFPVNVAQAKHLNERFIGKTSCVCLALENQDEQSRAIKSYYRQMGRLYEVDASRTIPEIHCDVEEYLVSRGCLVSHDVLLSQFSSKIEGRAAQHSTAQAHGNRISVSILGPGFDLTDEFAKSLAYYVVSFAEVLAHESEYGEGESGWFTELSLMASEDPSATFRDDARESIDCMGTIILSRYLDAKLEVLGSAMHGRRWDIFLSGWGLNARQVSEIEARIGRVKLFIYPFPSSSRSVQLSSESEPDLDPQHAPAEESAATSELPVQSESGSDDPRALRRNVSWLYNDSVWELAATRGILRYLPNAASVSEPGQVSIGSLVNRLVLPRVAFVSSVMASQRLVSAVGVPGLVNSFVTIDLMGLLLTKRLDLVEQAIQAGTVDIAPIREFLVTEILGEIQRGSEADPALDLSVCVIGFPMTSEGLAHVQSIQSFEVRAIHWKLSERVEAEWSRARGDEIVRKSAKVASGVRRSFVEVRLRTFRSETHLDCLKQLESESKLITVNLPDPKSLCKWLESPMQWRTCMAPVIPKVPAVLVAGVSEPQAMRVGRLLVTRVWSSGNQALTGSEFLGPLSVFHFDVTTQPDEGNAWLDTFAGRRRFLLKWTSSQSGSVLETESLVEEASENQEAPVTEEKRQGLDLSACAAIVLVDSNALLESGALADWCRDFGKVFNLQCMLYCGSEIPTSLADLAGRHTPRFEILDNGSEDDLVSALLAEVGN